MRGLACAVALAAVAGCTSLDPFLFNPERVDEYRWDEIDPQLDGELTDPHPSIVGADDRFEGFVDAGGRRVHYVFARRPGATETIFYSHGNRKHLGRYWDRVERLWSFGYHVMVYDYPGYGRSEGEPDEAGLYASAAAVYAALPDMPDVDPARVWLYGYSLGGGPTYELAVRAARGELPAPRGLVTESIFCSVETLVQDGAFVDLPDSYVSSYVIDNCGKAAVVSPGVPILMMHGTADSFLVPRHAELLHDAAPAARLEWIEGGEHSDLPLVAGDRYDQLVQSFIAP